MTVGQQRTHNSLLLIRVNHHVLMLLALPYNSDPRTRRSCKGSFRHKISALSFAVQTSGIYNIHGEIRGGD